MARKEYEIICINCGNKKITHKKNQKFCCHECSVEYRMKQKRKIINGVVYKKCSICKEFYPLTNDYFTKAKTIDGFYCNCKKCENEKNRIKYRTNEEYRIKCNSVDKEKKRIRRHNYYIKNRQKEIDRAKKYNFENRDKIREREKQYRHTERGSEVNKLKCQKRRRNMKSKGIMKIKDWQICKDYFRNDKGIIECPYCGKEIKIPTIEHFIPISKGGENDKTNILPICKSCNCSKQDKDFFEWYKEKEFYSEERIEKILKYFEYIKTIPSHD